MIIIMNAEWHVTLVTRLHSFRKEGTRTGRPQPTQSNTTVPLLLTPPLGVLAGVSASLGGVLGLEPGNVLCDALAAAALNGTGGCTKGRRARRSVISAGLHKQAHGKGRTTFTLLATNTSEKKYENVSESNEDEER